LIITWHFARVLHSIVLHVSDNLMRYLEKRILCIIDFIKSIAFWQFFNKGEFFLFFSHTHTHTHTHRALCWVAMCCDSATDQSEKKVLYMSHNDWSL